MATAKENLDRQIGQGNADAIEALVDEKLQARSEDLETLRQEIVALREEVGDIPELKRQLQAAAGLLRGAIDDHNELVDRRNAGEPVSEREVAEDEVRVQRVSTDVESVRDELEQRVTALEDQVGRNDSEGLRGAVKDAQTTADSAKATADEALRLAQSNSGSAGGGKAFVGPVLITLIGVMLLVWLIMWLIPGDQNNFWGLFWGIFAAALVALFLSRASKPGTKTNTFVGDLRDTRRVRREREETPEEETSSESTSTRVVEKKEKVSA